MRTKTRVQRKAPSRQPARKPTVDAGAVDEVLRAGGSPLEPETRSAFGERLGHDFARVRVHTDARAGESAKALNAHAYTVGSHVVFGQGRYAPGTKGGAKLLAHELTHVAQQGAVGSTAATGTVQRATVGADGWSSDYDKKQSFLRKDYDTFKKGLGTVRPSTSGGLTANTGRFDAKGWKPMAGAGTPAAPFTFDMLTEIYPDLKKDVLADKKKEAQAKRYAEQTEQAFRVMQIDTVEAQSVYLAHAFVESGQFRAFTETQAALQGGAHRWTDDPTTLPMDKKVLAAQGSQFAQGGDINPFGEFEFIGRGPVQVTHRPEYVENIAMLEKTAEQYEAQARGGGNPEAAEFGRLARKAADAVKKDPRRAADPEFAFLFSAAFMKRSRADVKAASVRPGVAWTGNDAASGWVAGGLQAAGSPQAAALVDKGNAFTAIHKVLMREAQKAAAAKSAQEAKDQKQWQQEEDSPSNRHRGPLR